MRKVILVASGKGGTGKTSLTAAVGTALAEMGKKVLVIDGDCGLRNLDLVLGMSELVCGRGARDGFPHPCGAGTSCDPRPVSLDRSHRTA